MREELEALIKQLTPDDPYIGIDPKQEENRIIIDKIIELLQ
jgi:hypothetical protein